MIAGLSTKLRIERLERQHDELERELAAAGTPDERETLAGTLDFVANVLAMLRERENHLLRHVPPPARRRRPTIAPAAVARPPRRVPAERREPPKPPVTRRALAMPAPLRSRVIDGEEFVTTWTPSRDAKSLIGERTTKDDVYDC